VVGVRTEFDTHVRGVLQRLAKSESFDVVADVADDLPLWLICRFLGLPVESRSDIAAFLVGTEAGFVDPLTPHGRESAEAGIVALNGYVEKLIADREATRRGDLVSDLLDAEQEGRLNRAELVALVVNVLGGAIGSSRAGIVNAILLLLQHPEQAAWVTSDPEHVAGAVEECLRYHPPFRAGRKLVAADNQVLGVDVKTGETVYLARQSANRDPARWADPDTFDVSRPPQRHYSFGYGAHFCIGQALARLDIEGAVAAFLELLPQARLLTVEPERVPFTPDEQIRELLVATRWPSSYYATQ
jgi:cytochrome P450